MFRLSVGGMAVALVALLAAPADSKSRPAPCPPGTFVLDAAAAAALTQAAGVPVSTLVIGDDRTLQLGECATTGRVKAKRKATTVAGKWTACGTGRKVKLKGAQAAPECQTLRGRVRAKKLKPVRFTATRATVACGNGTLDPGEACDGAQGCAGGATCSSSCTCDVPYDPPSTSQSLIADALARGAIDYPTSLLYRAWALFGDSALPPEYDGESWAHEDASLFLEIAGHWDDLPPATQAAVQPFVLRPTESGSYWHPETAGFAPAAATGAVECPFQPGAFAPDWRTTETDHFVIWSCGQGDPNSDVDAGKRVVVAGVAEQVWAAMVPETGAPRGDDLPTGPAPQSRIDVYLVTPNLCKSRPGGCAPLPLADGKPVLAAVSATTPCSPGTNGAMSAASYMILDRERIPTAAPAAPSTFRYTFAHEFFHVVENAMNLEAQGGTCAGGKPAEKVTSWLVEASAEWAAWAYFPADGPDERQELFRRFQTRPATSVSLRSLAFTHPYEAFLYPFFVQQETGARTSVVDLWKDSGTARNPKQLDDRLDTVLPFAEHFRDFAVRNLNLTAARLPGDPLPLAARHQAQDTAIPADVTPVLVQPTVTLTAPMDLQRPATMQALTAQYERYVVDPGARWVKIDLQTLGNAGFVKADVIANVKGTWERRRVPGSVFEFCRDEAADDIGELYLVLSHHDRREGLQAAGTYGVRTRPACPSGWSGTIRYRSTIDEHEATSGPSGIEITDDHAREEQQWVVAGTTPAGDANPFDVVELTWSGSWTKDRSYQRLNSGGCVGQVVLSTTTGRGSGDGVDRMTMIPGGGGWNPSPEIVVPFDGIEGTTAYYDQICTGQSVESSEPLGLHLDQFVPMLAGVPGLAMLQPDPDDPQRFHGEQVLGHVEEPRENGYFVQDIRVTWELRRR